MTPSKQTLPCPFEKKYPSSLNKDDEYYMWQAYNLAIDAWNNNEVPVGAVIVHEGEVIAAAHNQVETLRDPTAHAEILAITQAAQALQDWRLVGCTIYVSKEPCPMCAGAIIMARISRCIYAVSDPHQGCFGSAFSLHQHTGFFHRPEVTVGVLQQPCLELLQSFFRLKRKPTEQISHQQKSRFV